MENNIIPVKTQEGVEVNAINPEAVAAANPASSDLSHSGAAAKPKSKRGPGRPKTRTDTPQFMTEGIVSEPTMNNHLVEMVYGNPMIFRKIFALLKNFNIKDLNIEFTESTIEFMGVGHYTKETIQLTIFGEALTRYYVKENIKRTVSLPDIEKKTKTINKGHDKISLLVRDDDFRSTMYMILHVFQYDVDLPLPITFKQNTEDKVSVAKSDENYPIRFEFDSSQFKSIITSFDSGLSADTMVIKKVGDQPMFIIPQKAEKPLSDGMPFKNPQKIKLQSTVAPEDIFSTSVKILYFKALASANIGDKIEIAADKFGPISFTTWIDKRNVTKKVGDEILTNEGYAARLKLFVETEK